AWGDPTPRRSPSPPAGSPAAEFRELLPLRNKSQCNPVVTPALARRLRSVLEDVTLMRTAAGAVILGARNSQLVICTETHVPGYHPGEARPAGATLELGVGLEERQVTRRAHVGTFALLGVQRAGERTLRTFLEE